MPTTHELIDFTIAFLAATPIAFAVAFAIWAVMRIGEVDSSRRK